MTLGQELSAKQSNPDTQAKVISVSADMDNVADIKKIAIRPDTSEQRYSV
jgi:hypothetical protein